MLRGIVTFAAALLLASDLGAAEMLFDFSKTPEGQVPEKFSTILTGKGAAPEWKVLLDDAPTSLPPLTARGNSTTKSAVLAQTSADPTDEHFPVLVYNGDTYSDFTFTTKFKLVSGTKERMAGIVFRAQDKDNYYVLRASGLGNTFRFYKFVDGIRSEPIGVDLPIPSGVWHEISVQCEANKIRCFLNGKQVIPELKDNSFNVGKVGFWTKSDSVSHFTEAKVSYVPREIFAQKVLKPLMEKFPRTLALKIFAPALGSTNLAMISSTKEISAEEKKEDLTVANTALTSDTVMLYQSKEVVKVTLPLHDRNGEAVAVIRVELDPFLGQTEQTSINRATVYKKEVESRIKNLKDLYE